MNEIFDLDTMQALKKLAIGLTVREITEEYTKDDDGNLQLTKKKLKSKDLKQMIKISITQQMQQ